MTEVGLRRAEVRHILSNEFPDDWAAFETSSVVDPTDHYGWFEVEIGPEGDEGADLFQVVVATPKAIKRVRSKGKFRGLVIEAYAPEAAVEAIRAAVSRVSGYSWTEIVAALRETMAWEYEGMDGQRP